MIIDIKKKDLINMICGYCPDLSWVDTLKNMNIADYHDQYCKWSWKSDTLSKMTDYELYMFYQKIQNKCEIKIVVNNSFSWERAEKELWERAEKEMLKSIVAYVCEK